MKTIKQVLQTATTVEELYKGIAAVRKAAPIATPSLHDVLEGTVEITEQQETMWSDMLTPIYDGLSGQAALSQRLVDLCNDLSQEALMINDNLNKLIGHVMVRLFACAMPVNGDDAVEVVTAVKLNDPTVSIDLDALIDVTKQYAFYDYPPVRDEEKKMPPKENDIGMLFIFMGLGIDSGEEFEKHKSMIDPKDYATVDSALVSLGQPPLFNAAITVEDITKVYAL